MAYLTTDELRAYIGGFESGDSTTDEDQLQDAIDDAVAEFEEATGLTFEASTETRYFTYGVDTDDSGFVLHLDKPLLTVTTLTNGDGTVIPSTDYKLRPLNESPKYEIALLPSKGRTWAYVDDAEGAISVAGTWGYSATVPTDVKRAVKRLAAYYYKQRDAVVEQVTADPETGQLILPPGYPKDVYKVIRRYASGSML